MKSHLNILPNINHHTTLRTTNARKLYINRNDCSLFIAIDVNYTKTLYYRTQIFNVNIKQTRVAQCEEKKQKSIQFRIYNKNKQDTNKQCKITNDTNKQSCGNTNDDVSIAVEVK